MASAYAIAATGQALLGLLASAVPREEFSAAQFEIYQAKNFQSPMDEGISLYLYRVTPAPEIRNMPPRVGPDGRRYRTAVPINLHYLLTAWARDSVKQHRLLGWAIRVLEDTPILSAGVLNQAGPEIDIFRFDETVDFVMETVSIQDQGSVWEVARHHMQPSVFYVARMLGIDSVIPISENGAVQTRVFRAGNLVPA
ncbi:MAG: DUF4255 domain-containing protein [Acidobacteriota bacterium]|nr:DUF4255 domain-containing protein [Acidobacteriota bacterium]